RICLRATATDPLQRHASAAALGEELRRYVRRSRRRSRLLPAACGLLAVLVAAGAGARLLRPGKALPGPERADVPPKAPPPTVAERARKVLEASCYRCHGQGGNAEGGFNYVLDHRQLLARGKM